MRIAAINAIDVFLKDYSIGQLKVDKRDGRPPFVQANAVLAERWTNQNHAIDVTRFFFCGDKAAVDDDALNIVPEYHLQEPSERLHQVAPGGICLAEPRLDLIEGRRMNPRRQVAVLVQFRD